ncbi:hypothetical protein ACFL1V_02690 [Pseudomonadota bacterium]
MKSTDRIPARHIRRLRQIRARVAAEAARIIATEGQHNYHAAKKKAAERIGESERLALPSNIEVKEALRAYQNLYGGEQHQDNLDRLRTIAIEAMHLLDAFNPRLVGSVLDGTADEHSRISLHVFCDSPDSMVLHFLENSVPFHQEQRQIRWHDGNHRMVPLIVFDLDDTTVELSVFDPIILRQAPPSPIDGKPQQRATLTDVECLLAEALSPLISLPQS